MVNTAQQYEAEDKIKREQIDIKNQADSLCYQSEKQLKELSDKITEDDKNKLESLIKQLRDSVKEENFDSMKALSKELEQELMAIGQKIYSQKNESNSPNSNPSENDNVIDTEGN